jgi:large subunit ribosomal protein L21
MKYAVFASGGKQYKVKEGDNVELEKLKAEAGGDVVFDDVLLLVSDDGVKVGQPNVAGVTIAAKVLEHTQGKKIRVAKFKAKARYRRVYGHRQEITKVQIEKIGVATEKKEKTVKKNDK